MDAKVTVTKQALRSMLDIIEGEPGPDDAPIPDILIKLRELLRHWHPWPPGPDPDPRHHSIYDFQLKLSELPNPRQFGFMTRRIISTFIEHYELAAAMGGVETNGGLTKVIAGRVTALSEQICGNEVHGPHISLIDTKGGGGFTGDARPINPFEVLAASRQFERAAQRLANHPLQQAMSKAAELTLNVGMERLNATR